MTDELERASFEKWKLDTWGTALTPGGSYELSLWETWQARATLSSRGDAGTLRKWEPEFGAVLASLTISAQNLLDWVPTCSVGSSGYLRIEALKAALKKFGELPSYSCPHCGNTGAAKCEHWKYRAEAESALAHREKP